jgi:uncharacterized caspase-like protein
MTVENRPDPLRRALLGAAAAMPLTLAAQGTARVALVIGNAAYASAPLLNPGRDAAAVAGRLKALGFTVIERHDASRAQMASALDEAATALQGRSGIGLLYYAGHGLQIDWRNYLLPVDVQIATATDVPSQGLDVQRALEAFKAAGTRMNIVVLDACRDNPFGSAASGRGLAPLDAPPGTFLAYATAPGNVAEDGSAVEGHGVYTRQFLRALEQPDTPIEDLFKRVRLQVRRATDGRQIPWESTSLEEDFAFGSGQRLAAPGLAEREALFEAQRREWERIRPSARLEDFYAFLQTHPNGVFAELAQAAIDRLARPAVQAQAPAALAGVSRLPPGAQRFALGDRWDVEIVDHLQGDARVRAERRVTALDGPRVIVNGGDIVLDQLGSLLVNRTGVKNPGILLVPSDLRAGMRWRADFTNLSPGQSEPTQNFYDLRVVGIEELDLPFGRIRAFRVEAEGQIRLPSVVLKMHTTNWVDPATMLSVRTEFRRFMPGGRRLGMHDTTTVVSRSLAPR